VAQPQGRLIAYASTPKGPARETTFTVGVVFFVAACGACGGAGLWLAVNFVL